MRITKLVAIGVVPVAFAAAALSLLVPSPEDKPGVPSLLALSVAITILQVTAAALFISGFRYFRTQLKVAYSMICAGIVLLGVAQLQVPLVALLEQTEGKWAQGGIIVLPFLAAIILLYFGVRHFAKLMGVRSILNSFWFVMLLSVAAAAIGAALPHGRIIGAEVDFRATVGLTMWGDVFLIATAVMAGKIKQVAGPVFSGPMDWLYAAIMTVAAVGLVSFGTSVLFGNDTAWMRYGMTLAPHLFGAILFLRAGYAFVRINSTDAVSADKPTGSASLIEIVVFASKQVSNPKDIDDTLDNLRGVTASIQGGQALTPEQEQRLRQAYLGIENYLVNKDPVRQLTADDVRQQIIRHFNLDPARATFWQAEPTVTNTNAPGGNQPSIPAAA